MNSGHFREAAAHSVAMPLGRVLLVSGSQADVRLGVTRAPNAAPGDGATVGKFLGIHTGISLVVGVITRISTEATAAGGAGNHATGQLDLLGEIRHHGTARAFFQRGVTQYPMIGDAVELITPHELRLMFDVGGSNTIDIGHLQQDASIPAYINVDNMVRKHFALFGTTGVGKSSGLALILREILNVRPDLRIFLIDPHNEYGHCFDRRAQVVSPKNLKLPFWLFNFEEIVDVFFRGRPGVEEEVEILSEVIPQAKAAYAPNREAARHATIKRDDPKGLGLTVDTPVPYLLKDLVDLIEARMGKLENRSNWSKYHRLMTRIDTARSDPRYAFMFDDANVGGDTMTEVLSQLFRLPPNGVPMTIMQLAGLPAEVVDSVVSVVCRMAFEFGLWSDGGFPVLVVCEEAHRYAPADRTIGFGPTRKAISRIAKEGRKYGVFLGLVTQRPAELDPTIISQCSTLFAMRMANDADQNIVRAAVLDAAKSLLGFIPSLGTREVFAFGEGVALPTRLHFKELAADLIPRSEAISAAHMDAARSVDRDLLAAIVERWRGATMGGKAAPDDIADIDAAAFDEFSRVRGAPSLDPDRSAPVAKTATFSPDSFFFPVDPPPARPARPLRKS